MDDLNYSLECIHYLNIANSASIIFSLLTNFFTISFLLSNLFTIKFVHHIFQCHKFSPVSFIYIFFTIDLASFFGSFPLSFLTMLFDLKLNHGIFDLRKMYIDGDGLCSKFAVLGDSNVTT